MATSVAVTVLPAARTLRVEPGVTILRAAHEHGVDITATCGGRGRCTSCRVKFMAGTPPPPTIMDELQLGDALVREGYRLSCQSRVTEPITVHLAPPLDEHTFQILGADAASAARSGIAIDSGVRKEVTKVALPREEHHQTSDLEALLAATGAAAGRREPGGAQDPAGALREHGGEVTVTTFGPRVLSVEPGDTALLKFGLAFDIGTTSVVGTLMDLASRRAARRRWRA